MARAPLAAGKAEKYYQLMGTITGPELPPILSTPIPKPLPWIICGGIAAAAAVLGAYYLEQYPISTWHDPTVGFTPHPPPIADKGFEIPPADVMPHIHLMAGGEPVTQGEAIQIMGKLIRGGIHS